MRAQRTRTLKGLLPLAIGVLVGAAATAALVLLVAGLVRGDTPSTASGPPRFVEETAGSGIAHTYDGDFEYFVGGGVAVFDCNDDLLPDLYFAGGSESAGLYVNGSEAGGQLRYTPASQPATGAYPPRCRWPTGTSTWLCFGSARTRCCAGGEIAGSSRPTS